MLIGAGMGTSGCQDQSCAPLWKAEGDMINITRKYTQISWAFSSPVQRHLWAGDWPAAF